MRKAKISSKILFTLLALLLTAVTVFCGVQIWLEHRSRQKDASAFIELAELAEIKRPDVPKEATGPDTTVDTQEESETSVSMQRHDISQLISMNNDCIGWLSIGQTSMNYPVMCTPEWPQKYLRMNFYQQYSDSGVPFLDPRCTPDSDNLIIYGHNMRNGTMFSSLVEYLNAGRIPSNQIILFETKDEAYEFEIFAVAVVDKADPWYSFINAGSEDGFNETVQTIVGKASILAGEIPRYGDRLLTLSTCFGEDKSSRLIVIAIQKQ